MRAGLRMKGQLKLSAKGWKLGKFEMRTHSLSLTLLTIVVVSAYDIAKTSQDGGEGENEERNFISLCKRRGRGRGVASTGVRRIRYHLGGTKILATPVAFKFSKFSAVMMPWPEFTERKDKISLDKLLYLVGFQVYNLSPLAQSSNQIHSESNILSKSLKQTHLFSCPLNAPCVTLRSTLMTPK